MALTEEIVGKTWDRAYRSGHRCGYMDALGEVWIYMKDMPASDPRYAVLIDLADFLRERRESVLAHIDEEPTTD